jgi:hypothetical protein
MSIEQIIVELRMMGIYIGLDCIREARDCPKNGVSVSLWHCEAGEKQDQLNFSFLATTVTAAGGPYRGSRSQSLMRKYRPARSNHFEFQGP